MFDYWSISHSKTQILQGNIKLTRPNLPKLPNYLNKSATVKGKHTLYYGWTDGHTDIRSFRPKDLRIISSSTFLIAAYVHSM